MAAIQLYLDDWPIAVCVAPAGSSSDDEFDAFLSRYGTELGARAGQFIQIVDLRAGGALTPKQRKRLTDSMALPEGTAKCVGTALVFNSSLLRGMLTAILWVRQPQYPTQVFATVDEAKLWGRRHLRDLGVLDDATSPPAVRR